MIRSCKDTDTQKLVDREFCKKFSGIEKQARMRLDRLSAATSLNDLAIPGSVLTFNATLANIGSAVLFLNGDNFLSSGLPLDDTLFFANVPPSLASSASVTSDIFQISIPQGAVAGTYFGSFTILGGSSGNAQDAIATQNFQVTVSAVPEPASIIVPSLFLLFIFFKTMRRSTETRGVRGDSDQIA